MRCLADAQYGQLMPVSLHQPASFSVKFSPVSLLNVGFLYTYSALTVYVSIIRVSIYHDLQILIFVAAGNDTREI